MESSFGKSILSLLRPTTILPMPSQIKMPYKTSWSDWPPNSERYIFPRAISSSGFDHHYQRAIELERARLELQASKRQCELVKSLLADATAEKEIMYEVRPVFLGILDLTHCFTSRRPSMRSWTGCITMPTCPMRKLGMLYPMIYDKPKRPRIIYPARTRMSVVRLWRKLTEKMF
jgi:hypothetical protein